MPNRIVQWAIKNFVQVALNIFALGGLWVWLTAAVADRPTRQEMVEAVQVVTDSVSVMATDVRTIRILLCRQSPTDSFCVGDTR